MSRVRTIPIRIRMMIGKDFRIDFVIYSAMSVVMGYYVKFKYR